MILNDYIREVVLETIRSSQKGAKFDFNSFKQFEQLSDAYSYAKQRLRQLGSGSSRTTFVLSSGKVLKISNGEKNNAGAEQNKKEHQLYSQVRNSKPLIVPKVFAADSNHNWIVSELVNPFQKGEPKKLSSALGIQPFPFVMFVALSGKGQFDFIQKSLQKQNHKNPEHILAVANAIHNLVKVANLVPIDLQQTENWGINSEGNPVIVDTGLDEEISGKYYVNK